jgi:hypothetical protein
VLSTQPRLTIGNSLLLITNHLSLGPSSVFNFLLGTNPAYIGIRSNFVLSGTINITDGGGLSNGTYLLFTNGGTVTSNSTIIATKPAGATCGLDTSTPGQVKVNILRSLAPPVILGEQFLNGAFQMTLSGPALQTYKVLASTNISLAVNSWTVLTNGSFPVSGPFIDDSAGNYQTRFYRIISP